MLGDRDLGVRPRRVGASGRRRVPTCTETESHTWTSESDCPTPCAASTGTGSSTGPGAPRRPGFSSLGTLDRIAYGNYESLIALAAAAAVTERIRLVTDIMIAPLRANTALLAKQSATIDHLCGGGRVVLGLAPGGREDDYALSGVDFHRRGRIFDEPARGVAALAVAFLVVTVALGTRLVPPLFELLHRLSRSAGTLMAIALAFTLAVSELATPAKLAPIVGAFVAGLSLARSRRPIASGGSWRPSVTCSVPVFFLQIGIDAQIDQFFDPHVLGDCRPASGGGRDRQDRSPLGAIGAPGDKLLLGLGMLPRGEVGLIFATIGLQGGILGKDLYAALLLVILVTTLSRRPSSLRLNQIRGRRRRRAAATARPARGRMAARGGRRR